MRSKTPLVLMEQMVMILVFALAAALCLQAFVKSDEMSRQAEARDRAAVLCQNVAEILRSGGGDMSEAAGWAAAKLGYRCEQASLRQEFDEDWQPVERGVYRLEAEELPTEVSGLVAAYVHVETVRRGGGELLFGLEVAWQGEVTRLG